MSFSSFVSSFFSQGKEKVSCRTCHSPSLSLSLALSPCLVERAAFLAHLNRKQRERRQGADLILVGVEFFFFLREQSGWLLVTAHFFVKRNGGETSNLIFLLPLSRARVRACALFPAFSPASPARTGESGVCRWWLLIARKRNKGGERWEKRNTKEKKTMATTTAAPSFDEHLPRGVSASTTGIFVLDVLALATMAACVPTLKLFMKKRRHWNLVSGAPSP